MKFTSQLIEGVLIKRYKRFLTDVKLVNGKIVVAHCANPGSMLSVNTPGSRVWLSPAQNPMRKLKFTWEIIEVNGHLVGINTAHPNKIVADAINDGKIEELKGYKSLKREQKYGKNSRIYILLTNENQPPCYVEVKNVTMKRGGPNDPAEFPDSVTTRGAKHLVEMADMVKKGARAVMVYLVQRSDCASFSIAADIDPAYAKGLKSALAEGVEAICYSCEVSPNGVTIAKPLILALPN